MVNNTVMNEEKQFICQYCGKICKNANSHRNHERLCHDNPNRQISSFVGYLAKLRSGDITVKVWNKGLTKNSDARLKRAGQKYSDGIKSGKIKPPQLGKKLSNEHRKHVSEGMKKAHAEGRAHNIGECRWNNKPSWPEQWFMSVIKNEFNDKNFKREFSFHKFSLDFAWVEKKKCIEIDGQQHERDEEQKRRDCEKEQLLKEDGWELLRMPWKEVYKDTKIWIEKAKAFIDE